VLTATDAWSWLCEEHRCIATSTVCERPENTSGNILEAVQPDIFQPMSRDFIRVGKSLGGRPRTMMTAEECLARADTLIRLTDECRDIDMVVELEETAAEWRRLAAVADGQTALWVALAETRD
jgi:hypothetical protein